MANKYHNGQAKGGKGAPTGSNAGRKSPGTTAPFPEKVGFPSAQLPGKAQPSRAARASLGDGCDIYADSKGLE